MRKQIIILIVYKNTYLLGGVAERCNNYLFKYIIIINNEIDENCKIFGNYK